MPEDKDPIQRTGYSPAETAAVRNETLSRIIRTQQSVMKKADHKTNLDDLDAVQKTANEYLLRCQEACICPSFEGLSAALGWSRKHVYQRMRENPFTEVTRYFEVLQTEFAAIRTAAAENKVIDSTFAMFQLLNSNLGYTNRHDVAFTNETTNPMETGESVEDVRARYIAALPDDE